MGNMFVRKAFGVEMCVGKKFGVFVVSMRNFRVIFFRRICFPVDFFAGKIFGVTIFAVKIFGVSKPEIFVGEKFKFSQGKKPHFVFRRWHVTKGILARVSSEKN